MEITVTDANPSTERDKSEASLGLPSIPPTADKSSDPQKKEVTSATAKSPPEKPEDEFEALSKRFAALKKK